MKITRHSFFSACGKKNFLKKSIIISSINYNDSIYRGTQLKKKFAEVKDGVTVPGIRSSLYRV